jgi:hypothetical protein
MPSIDESRSELLGKGLKAAVVGWDPTDPENRDSHTVKVAGEEPS